MSEHFQTPDRIRAAYENGLPGWQFQPDTMDRLMADRKALLFAEASPHLAGVGKGKMALLWRSREKYDPGAFGQEAQTTGDCVSHGSRNAREVTRCVEIHIKREPEEFYRRTATEPTYGARGHGGQGMDPARATRFESDYGFLFRQQYPFTDLSVYDSRIGSRWGASGVPEAVKEECRKHNVGQWIAPTTVDQVKDLLYAGYGLHSGQNLGVRPTSDSRGIAIPSGSWSHDLATLGYDATREVYPVCVFLVANSWGCYDEETEVLTRDGWKRFAHVLPDDEIATLNPRSHELEYQRPTAFHRYPYVGNLLRYRSPLVDLLVTPNHNLYVAPAYKDRGDPFSWRMRPAISCPATCHMKKDAIWHGEEVGFHEVGPYRIPMDDWLRFLGYFLSEGHLLSRDRTFYRVTSTGESVGIPCAERAVGISQIKQRPHAIMAETMQRMPFRVRPYRSGEGWATNDRHIHADLAVFGKQPTRFVPEYVKSLSRRQIQIFFDALMLGDGTQTQNKMAYYTSSRRLADDVQELALKIGLCADIGVIDRRGQRNASGVYRHLEYQVRIKRQRLRPKPCRGWLAVAQHYSGFVHCLTVPNHIMYVRRNGRAVWCGNSWNERPQVWPEDRYGPWPAGSFWVAEDVYARYFVGSRSIFAYLDVAGYPQKNLPDYGDLKDVLG